MTALLNCPFCGAQLDSHDILSDGIVECPSCFVRNFSVDEWNHRATPADRGAPAEGAVPGDQKLESLAMMIRMLVSALRRAKPCAPENLDYRALDLLRRYGLQGSPLRDAAPTSQAGRDALDARKRALEEAASLCEEIADTYCERESGRYPELKSDAESGARNCENAIRATIASSAQAGQGEQI